MGEFKKRIKKVLEWHDEAVQTPERDKMMMAVVLEIIEDAKKNLLKCKTYDELRKEIERWFSE